MVQSNVPRDPEIGDAQLALKEMQLGGYDISFPKPLIENKSGDTLIGAVKCPSPEPKSHSRTYAYQLYYGPRGWLVCKLNSSKYGMITLNEGGTIYGTFEEALRAIREYFTAVYVNAP